MLPNNVKNPPTKIGLICGTGLEKAAARFLEHYTETKVTTPFGQPSDGIILEGVIKGVPCALVSRHGRDHQFSPEAVNYRANLWALAEVGCTHVLTTSACGSLREDYAPGDLVLFDQFYDRTTKRGQSFYDGTTSKCAGVCHIPMGEPFCTKTREILKQAADSRGYKCHATGSVVTIEGPRFSSRAESIIHKQLGLDVVNMTTVPEVILANELGLCYATVGLVTDYDAWKSHPDEHVSVEAVFKILRETANRASNVILDVIPLIATTDFTTVISARREVATTSVIAPPQSSNSH